MNEDSKRRGIERRKVTMALKRTGLNPATVLWIWVLYDVAGIEATLERIKQLEAERVAGRDL